MCRRFRTPLVVFTPKSLLRLPRATSRVDELASGRFQVVLSDAEARANPGAVSRVVLCSGKVYYDLLEERLRRHGDAKLPVALVRVEQLYPWPEASLVAELAAFPEARELVWCQEEPANMGAWTFGRERVRALLGPEQRLRYSGRLDAASPAVGSARIHKQEQAALVRQAFGED
jgi:2-oxoglutarate dehydrogenase complex dehydrogenase (E1) component-like enzyme